VPMMDDALPVRIQGSDPRGAVCWWAANEIAPSMSGNLGVSSGRRVDQASRRAFDDATGVVGSHGQQSASVESAPSTWYRAGILGSRRIGRRSVRRRRPSIWPGR